MVIVLLSYLLPDGELTSQGKETWHSLTDDLKIKMYQWMYFLRFVDRRCVSMQRQGKIGTYVPIEGQEASQVGSALAIHKQDWLFPTYRDHGAELVAGVPLYQILLYWMGRVEGNRFPEELNIIPPTVPIATQLPHAVGVAWAAKLQHQDTVAVAYLGDGATSEGDFHEACNFAGVFRLPVIFFCQNNGYAISVPFCKQSATKTVAEKAKAYAITGIQVDGNDILAVYDVVKQRVNLARRKHEPVLIEAITYRTGGHTTADDPTKYRNHREEKQWREKDPLIRYKRLLEKEKLLTERSKQEWHETCERMMGNAIQLTAESRKPMKQHLFAHVFADKMDGRGLYDSHDNGGGDL